MLASRSAAMRRAALAPASRTMASFTGVWPIMATPFNADETVDLEGFDKCISFMKDAGCDGATIIGVLGESNRLMDSEREALIKTCAPRPRSRLSCSIHATALLPLVTARASASLRARVLLYVCVAAGRLRRRVTCRSASARATRAPSRPAASRRWRRSAARRR